MQEHKVHKYMRCTLGDSKYVILKCMLPNCAHYIAQVLGAGRLSICWRCGKEFLMSQKDIYYKRPHCVECTKSKQPKIQEFVGELK